MHPRPQRAAPKLFTAVSAAFGPQSRKELQDAVDECLSPDGKCSHGPIGSWNVSAVTDMHRMFSGATSFDQDLSSWDVSAVTDMGWMFENALDFNQDLSPWDVSAVTNMGGMFRGATSFNRDLSRVMRARACCHAGPHRSRPHLYVVTRIYGLGLGGALLRRCQPGPISDGVGQVRMVGVPTALPPDCMRGAIHVRIQWG